MNTQMLKLLIERKSEFLHVICSASMVWWTSSVLFSGTLLGAVWLKRRTFGGVRYFNYFAFVVLCFFLSIVFFGLWIAFYFCPRFSASIAPLLSQASAPADIFKQEIFLYKVGMLDATSSFVLFLCAWVGLWLSIKYGKD